MTDLERPLLRRWTGRRIVAVSLGFGLCGMLPLLAYIAFGPADGNPVGLGLLAVACVPVAMIGVLVGVIKLLVETFAGKGR